MDAPRVNRVIAISARAHVGLTLLATVSCVLSGLVMRAHLMAPEGLIFGSVSAYGGVFDLHGAMAPTAIVMPLLVFVFATYGLARYTSQTPAPRRQVGAVVAHALSVACVVVANLTSLGEAIEPKWALFAWSLVPLVVGVALQLSIVVATLARVSAARRSPGMIGLAIGGLGAVGFLTWASVSVLSATFAVSPAGEIALAARDAFDALARFGLPYTVGLLAGSASLELALRGGGAHRVFAVGMFIALLGFALIKQRLDRDLYLNDSYFDVGLQHLLYGGALVFVGLALLVPSGSRSLGRAVACVVTWLTMCVSDALLGMHGMPKYYYQYDPVFASRFDLTALASYTFTTVALVVLFTWWRERRLGGELAKRFE